MVTIYSSNSQDIQRCRKLCKNRALYVSDYLQLLPHKNRRQLQAVCLRDVGGDQVKNASDIGQCGCMGSWLS